MRQLSGAGLPFFHQRIRFLAMADAEDKDFISLHPEYDTIISDPEFPVTLERLSQRFGIFLRGNHETGFYCSPDPLPDITVELRDIPLFDIGMIDD